MRIIVTNHYPHEWSAIDEDSYDGPGSPIGLGNSRQEAIEDLKDQLLERDVAAAEGEWKR